MLPESAASDTHERPATDARRHCDAQIWEVFLDQKWTCIDGNEAAARVAYALSEVIAIYPITPSSPMGEAADGWAAAGKPNLWGVVPDVVEMQSEAGAAGALHGALQRGALSGQLHGLAGPAADDPQHVQDRRRADPRRDPRLGAHDRHACALHLRGPQRRHARAHDRVGDALLGLGAGGPGPGAHRPRGHAAGARARSSTSSTGSAPRTRSRRSRSLSDDDLRALVPEDEILAFRGRALTPDAPLVRGTRRTPTPTSRAARRATPSTWRTPGIVAEAMAAFEARTGRPTGLVEYEGPPDAERVIVLMGSGVGATEQVMDALAAAGEKVGLVKVRLYRPFPTEQFVAALPETVRSIAVLDRTKEPGSTGEPLYLDVVTALAEHMDSARAALRARAAGHRRPLRPVVEGVQSGNGQGGLRPSRGRPPQASLHDRHHRRRDAPQHPDGHRVPLPRPAGEVQAMFFGTGSDGTVGANKNSVKIIGEGTDLYAQGYFVYDSKKAGSVTVSHLRFGPNPIRSSYLIERADFVACHKFGLLGKLKVLGHARDGGTFLLNSPYPADEVWDHLPECIQELLARASHPFLGHRRRQSRRRGRHGQTRQYGDAALLLRAVRRPAGRRGHLAHQGVRAEGVRQARARHRREELRSHRPLPAGAHRGEGARSRGPAAARRVTVPDDAPDFVKRVTVPLLAGEGDQLPVSAFPVDGSYIASTL